MEKKAMIQSNTTPVTKTEEVSEIVDKKQIQKAQSSLLFGKEALHFSYKESLTNQQTWSELIGSVLPDAEYFLQELQQSVPHLTVNATNYPSILHLLEPIGIYSNNITYSTYKYINILMSIVCREAQHPNKIRLERDINIKWRRNG
jgi:hypothetical protein